MKIKLVLVLTLISLLKVWSAEVKSLSISDRPRLAKYDGTKNCSNDLNSPKNTWLEINQKDKSFYIRTLNGIGESSILLYSGYRIVLINCERNSILIERISNDHLMDRLTQINLNTERYPPAFNSESSMCHLEAVRKGEELINLKEIEVKIFEKLNDPSSSVVGVIPPLGVVKT